MANNDTAPQPPMTPRERQYVIDALTFDYAQEWRQFLRAWFDSVDALTVVAPNIETWIARWPQYEDELRAFDACFRAGHYHGYGQWDTPSDAQRPLSATGERVLARIRAQRREGQAE